MEQVRQMIVLIHVKHEHIIQRHEIVVVQRVKMDIIVNDEQIINYVPQMREVIIKIRIIEEKI